MSKSTEPTVIIRYPNLSGAVVEVTERTEFSFGDVRTSYAARCTACLDFRSPVPHLDRPREWASTHCATCRALPQPEPTDQ